MELAKKHWKILEELDRDFTDKVREFLVIGNKGDGVVMATEPYGEGIWYGTMEFGRKLRKVTEPTRLGVSGLVSMAQSNYHIVLLDNRGQCYSMGMNDRGRLGLGIDSNEEIYYTPQLIPCPYKFISVRCGCAHSLALTEGGKVWGWGDNSGGQLGQPDSTSTISSPLQISQLSGHRVVAIACGVSHSLALTDRGEVYAWGNNQNGQLGHKDGVEFRFKKYLKTPTKLAIPSPSPVIQISAGPEHTLLLTEDGLVFGCGLYSPFRPNSNRSNLQQISGLPPIAQIYSHFYNFLAIALSTDRRCWVWGEWDNSPTSTPLQLSTIYSTVDSPLSSGSSCRFTPHSVRVKGLQSPHPLKSPLTSNSDTEFELSHYTFLGRISRMFDNPDSNPDLQFVLGEKSILAHRSILQISGHFSRLFAESSGQCADLIPTGPSTSSPQSDPTPTRNTTNPSEPNSDTPSIPSITRIPITGHSYPTFHSFIRFFYTDRLQVSPDLLPDLFELSHRFECPRLQRLFLSRMHFTVTLSTCCPYYQLAVRHQLSQLQSRVVKFISDNLLQVFRTEAYRSLDAELIKKLNLAVSDLQLQIKWIPLCSHFQFR